MNTVTVTTLTAWERARSISTAWSFRMNIMSRKSAMHISMNTITAMIISTNTTMVANTTMVRDITMVTNIITNMKVEQEHSC